MLISKQKHGIYPWDIEIWSLGYFSNLPLYVLHDKVIIAFTDSYYMDQMVLLKDSKDTKEVKLYSKLLESNYAQIVKLSPY